MKKKVSVVIPAYNEEKLIGRCLKSLINQDFPRDSFEIIVVNNNSTDKTEEIAKKYADKVILETQKGLLYARQTGFNAASTNIIFRTDADCEMPSDWIKKGWEYFKKHKNIVAVSGFYYPDDNNKLMAGITWLMIQFKYIRYRISGKIEWLTGPCSGFKKEAFKKVGGFDVESDPVIEDQQGIAYRLNKVGKVAFCPDWWVWFSMRRVNAKKRGIIVFLKDYFLYQALNNIYFSLFKKTPKKIIGSGWEDIRE